MDEHEIVLTVRKKLENLFLIHLFTFAFSHLFDIHGGSGAAIALAVIHVSAQVNNLYLSYAHVITLDVSH